MLGDVTEQPCGGTQEDGGGRAVGYGISLWEEAEHIIRCRVGAGADVWVLDTRREIREYTIRCRGRGSQMRDRSRK
jgi:hypothetical protein